MPKDSKKSLANIRNQIIEDPANSWATEKGWEPVYTAGTKAKIVIIGQAPGRAAQTTHKPWNDKSGENLRDWLGISNEQFYDPDIIALVPMDFYYPGKAKHGDKPPRPDFAPKWHPLLLEQMPNVKLILLVGQYSQKHYLGKDAKHNLTETVRNYQEYLPDYLPLVHPSPLNTRWLSKNDWFSKVNLPHLKQLVSDALR